MINTNFVIIESPYKGRCDFEAKIHKDYLKLCVEDCILRGENPFCSHGYLVHFLDDNEPKERELGISLGISYYHIIKKSVVYTDLGLSEGMDKGILYAKNLQNQIEFRSIAKLKKVQQLVNYKSILNESRKI